MTLCTAPIAKMPVAKFFGSAVFQAGKDNGDDCEYDDEGSVAFGTAHTHGAEDTRGDGCPGEQAPEDGNAGGNQDKQTIFIH